MADVDSTGEHPFDDAAPLVVANVAAEVDEVDEAAPGTDGTETPVLVEAEDSPVDTDAAVEPDVPVKEEDPVDCPVVLPSSFFEKCYWSRDQKEISPVRSNIFHQTHEFRKLTGPFEHISPPHPLLRHMGYLQAVQFPASVIPGALSKITPRFKSENQPKCEDSQVEEEVPSLSCPQTYSSVILDSAVRQIAASLDADVILLDAMDLMAAETGPFGPEMSQALGHIYNGEASTDKDFQPWLQALVMAVPHISSENSDLTRTASRAPDQRRLIYLRNFRRIADVSLPLINVLLKAIQACRGAQPPADESSAPTVTYPTVIIRGVVGLRSPLKRKSESTELGQGSCPYGQARWAIPKQFLGLGNVFSTAWVSGRDDSFSDSKNYEKDYTNDSIVCPIFTRSISGTRLREIEASEALVLGFDLNFRLFQRAVKKLGGVIADDGNDPLAIVRQWAILNASGATALIPPLTGTGDGPVEAADIPEIITLAKSLLGLDSDGDESLKKVAQSAYDVWCSRGRPLETEDIAKAVQLAVISSTEKARWADEEALDEGDNANKAVGGDGDPVVKAVKAAKDLNEHETRLLRCIIDTTLFTTTFEDVCVSGSIIDSLRTVVSLPLLHPEAFQSGILQHESMSGVLLYGPPGTGKTMLCRALAKDCGARMLQVAPSDVNDMWLGESEKLVRAVFTLARRLGPCVVFIDEIDALFRSRDGRGSGHRETLIEFMQEMDGLRTASLNKKNNIIIVGATNTPYDLDDAVLRRLPRRALVDLPDATSREQILQVHLRGETLEGISLREIATRAQRFSGSDLKHLCVAAALAAVKDTIPHDWAKRRVGQEVKDDTAIVTPRVIRPKHMDVAFEQVSASSSENMGSVRKLREWSAKFGGAV